MVNCLENTLQMVTTLVRSDLLLIPSIYLDSAFSWASLENNLQQYLSNPEAHEHPFDIDAVPVVSKAEEQQDLQRKALSLLCFLSYLLFSFSDCIFRSKSCCK